MFQKKGLLLIVVLSICFIISSICYADYPLLTTVTYSADPSCLEYNGVLYSYWSNDDNNNGSYSMHQITCLSTNDLKHWTNNGQVFQVPSGASWASNCWAPAVVYRNGYFWMYFGNGGSGIGVAKSTSPTGPFTDAKGSALCNGSTPGATGLEWCFDPGILIDDDGQAYLYWGGGPNGTNARVIKLNSDMISINGSAVAIPTPNHFEDSWIHKYNGKYYYSYSTNPSTGMKINYLMSDNPMTGWVDKGTVMNNPPVNSNNNHHSIFQYRGNWYIGYHNRYVANQQGIDPTYKRNACLDQLYYNADGTMQLVTCTQNGLPLLPTPMSGPTPTPGPTSTPTTTPTPRSAFSQIEAESYNTRSGIQTESCGEGGQDVGYIENGDYTVYNNIDFGSGATSFQARVASATSGGNIEIRLDSITGALVGTCPVAGTGGWQTWTTSACSVSGASGTHNLYLKFTGGSGYLFNVNWFQFYSGSTPTPAPTPTPTPTSGNLITNPGIETGNTTGWAVNGAGTISASTAQKHSGSYSLLHTGRTATWNGLLQNITSKMQNGKTYACSGWVRLDNTASASIKMTIKKVDGNGTNYTNVATGTGSNSSWVQLSGNYTLTVSGTLTQLSIYFEGPGSGINMYVDDVSVQ